MDPNDPNDWTMPPTLASLATRMKADKARAVRRGEDVTHIVDVYRNGKRVLRVGVPDAEDILNLLWNAPGAMCADYIATACDAYEGAGATNPINGQPWRLGGMARAVEQDMALERGLVKEQITLVGFERAGATPGTCLPYKHDRGRRRIEWGTPYPYEAAGGRFPLAAADGFARPTLIEEMVRIAGPVPPDYDLNELIRRASVTYALRLPDHWRVIEGPKGPPLLDGTPWGRG